MDSRENWVEWNGEMPPRARWERADGVKSRLKTALPVRCIHCGESGMRYRDAVKKNLHIPTCPALQLLFAAETKERKFLLEKLGEDYEQGGYSTSRQPNGITIYRRLDKPDVYVLSASDAFGLDYAHAVADEYVDKHVV